MVIGKNVLNPFEEGLVAFPGQRSDPFLSAADKEAAHKNAEKKAQKKAQKKLLVYGI